MTQQKNEVSTLATANRTPRQTTFRTQNSSLFTFSGVFFQCISLVFAARTHYIPNQVCESFSLAAKVNGWLFHAWNSQWLLLFRSGATAATSWSGKSRTLVQRELWESTEEMTKSFIKAIVESKSREAQLQDRHHEWGKGGMTKAPSASAKYAYSHLKGLSKWLPQSDECAAIFYFFKQERNLFLAAIEMKEQIDIFSTWEICMRTLQGMFFLIVLYI